MFVCNSRFCTRFQEDSFIILRVSYAWWRWPDINQLRYSMFLQYFNEVLYLVIRMSDGINLTIWTFNFDRCSYIRFRSPVPVRRDSGFGVQLNLSAISTQTGLECEEATLIHVHFQIQTIRAVCPARSFVLCAWPKWLRKYTMLSRSCILKVLWNWCALKRPVSEIILN